jgi:hypothetical protein
MVIALCALVFSFLVPAQSVAAQDAPPPVQERASGSALCLPDVYLQTPDDCLPLGPSGFLTDMARKGLTFPLRPLPATTPAAHYNVVDVNFARISLPKEEKAPVYGSLEAAVAGESPSRFISGGMLRYVSFVSQQDVNGGHYVMLNSGEWMRASPAGYTTYQGLQFRETPHNGFGWIVDNAEIRAAPGYAAPLLVKSLPREATIQVFDTQEVDGTQWYMIGLNEWIEHRYARKVDVRATAPEGVDNNRWIEIDLFQQTLVAYDQGKVVFATLIASGIDPFWTRPGLFKIYQKKPLETMSGAFESDKSDYYYLEDVPWTMYFDEARAIHGAYWRTMFGYPQSHGCVNMSIGDSAWLYEWAQEGDWVYVHDPSGLTPTDPKLYGKGGA